MEDPDIRTLRYGTFVFGALTIALWYISSIYPYLSNLVLCTAGVCVICYALSKLISRTVSLSTILVAIAMMLGGIILTVVEFMLVCETMF